MATTATNTTTIATNETTHPPLPDLTSDSGISSAVAAGIITAFFWIIAVVACSASVHRVGLRAELGSLERWLHPLRRLLCALLQPRRHLRMKPAARA